MLRTIALTSVMVSLVVPAVFAAQAELKWQDYEQKGYMSTQGRKFAAVELALTNSLQRLTADESKIDDKVVLSALERLVTVTANQAKYEPSLEYAKLGIRYGERVGDKMRLASLYACQGNLQRQLGKYTQAELSYNRALSYDKQNAAFLCGLARVKCELKQFAAASTLYQQALEQKAFTPADFVRYAECCFKDGQHGKALSLLEQALEIDRKELGDGHPALAAEYNDMAVVKAGQGDMDGAKADMKRALEIAQKFKYTDLPEWTANLDLIH